MIWSVFFTIILYVILDNIYYFLFFNKMYIAKNNGIIIFASLETENVLYLPRTEIPTIEG